MEVKEVFVAVVGRYRFCVLAYDAASGELVTRANGNLEDRVGRATDNGQIGVIDPEHRLIGLHLYDGLFKVCEAFLLRTIASTAWRNI